MAQFKYRVRDKEGQPLSGIIDAPSSDAAADQLAAMSFTPIHIEDHVEAKRIGAVAIFKRVKQQDVILFSRQLSTLIGAGVPFLQSMTIVEKQMMTASPYFYQIIAELKRDVESGAAFSAALEKHPGVFSRMYISMISAAESAGILDSMLARLAFIEEHKLETQNRVKAAVRYPLIVLITIFAAFAFLVSFVIPRFVTVFAQFKSELPLPTRILIGINYVVQNYWYFIVGGAVLAAWGLVRYLHSTAGRWRWDSIKLRLPVFGVLFQKTALSRFARVFSGMQRSGLSMILTLDITAETVDNVVLAKAIENVRESVRAGKTLAEPMEASGLFPPLVVQMVAVGEETGELESMLIKVSEYYDKEVDYTLRNLSTLIEPVLLLFVGGLVLFLALGIFLPMWNLINVFKR